MIKNLKRIKIMLSICLALLMLIGTNLQIYAASNVKITDQSKDVIEINNDTIEFYVEESYNTIQIETVTNDTEIHTVLYEKGNDYFIMDGEKVHVEVQIEEDAILHDTDDILNGSLIKQRAVSPWTPVKLGTLSWNITKTVTTVGAIATVIGGVIAVAALAGIAIASSTIASTVANWAGAVGLGSLAAGFLFSGKLYADQVRTTGIVPQSNGRASYAYRWDNVKAVGTCKGKTMNQVLKKTGDWYWASR